MSNNLLFFVGKAQDAFRHSKAVTKLVEHLSAKTDDQELTVQLLNALASLCRGNGINFIDYHFCFVKIRSYFVLVAFYRLILHFLDFEF
jgi:hypothetical protein